MNTLWENRVDEGSTVYQNEDQDNDNPSTKSFIVTFEK